MSIYGDGKQVRDLLYVEDLVRAYDMAYRAGKKTRGGIYNIGGGMKNTMSVWREFQPMLEELSQRRIDVRMDTWRPGDQKIFVADIRKAKKEFGWEPSVSVRDGVERLYHWVSEHRSLFG